MGADDPPPKKDVVAGHNIWEGVFPNKWSVSSKTVTRTKARWESFPYLIDLLHSFAGTVKQIVHKAFWDHLESELNEDPPEYEHAIKLFEEIREVMFFLCIVLSA